KDLNDISAQSVCLKYFRRRQRTRDGDDAGVQGITNSLLIQRGRNDKPGARIDGCTGAFSVKYRSGAHEHAVTHDVARLSDEFQRVGRIKCDLDAGDASFMQRLDNSQHPIGVGATQYRDDPGRKNAVQGFLSHGWSLVNV